MRQLKYSFKVWKKTPIPMKIGGYYTNVSFYILLSFASCLSQVLKARNMLRFPLITVVLKMVSEGWKSLFSSSKLRVNRSCDCLPNIQR